MGLTKRRRIAPRRIEQTMPLWAQRLLEGERPPIYSDEHQELVDWLYFEAAVPGLPPARSDEGFKLWSQAKEVSLADEA